MSIPDRTTLRGLVDGLEVSAKVCESFGKAEGAAGIRSAAEMIRSTINDGYFLGRKMRPEEVPVGTPCWMVDPELPPRLVRRIEPHEALRRVWEWHVIGTDHFVQPGATSRAIPLSDLDDEVKG